ncbi:alpha/beta hydrolase [Streptomyces sp. NPDC058293]|uniref:alpha/beta hydrolase n=1 Tax=Streptomyces sp. NPDC058293 TaxID=3346429 RepID=UPI0036E3EAE3
MADWVQPGGPTPHLALYEPHLVILIHGFNVNGEEANVSYVKFRRELRSALSLGHEEVLGAFWEFHWPGDHPFKPVSTVTYSARIGAAESAGERLAEMLKKLSATQEVTLIAHSLGCRVALETVRRVLSGNYNRGARVRNVFLLAAAVPVHDCAARGRYSGEARDPEHVFYSDRDEVLISAFKLGQYPYHPSAKDEAVGQHGWPWLRWKTATRTRLRHGGYWSSRRVAREIVMLMEARHGRLLPDRGYASSGLPLQEREVISRTIPERALPVRIHKQ